MSERLIKLYKCDNCGDESEEEFGCMGTSKGSFDFCSNKCMEELEKKHVPKEK